MANILRVCNEHSPLTPLLPLEHHQRHHHHHDATRFGFSPITINQLLAQGNTPTVLKAKRFESPATALSPSSTASPNVKPTSIGGAIRKTRYSVPNNSPMPQPLQQAAEHDLHIGIERQRRQKPTISHKASSHRVKATASLPSNGQQQHTPRSSHTTSASEVDANNNNSSISSDSPKPAAAVAPGLDSALVLNILEDNQLGHLKEIFRREEIDLDVFCMMNRVELAQIGVDGDDDADRVVHIIQTLNRL